MLYLRDETERIPSILLSMAWRGTVNKVSGL